MNGAFTVLMLTTVQLLRFDPLWDRIRGNPRLEAPLMRYANQEQPGR
jgi:hypothetical protein